MIKNKSKKKCSLEEEFAYLSTSHFNNLIKRAKNSEALSRQINVSSKELVSKKGFSKNPLKEKNDNLIPHLLQKYSGRVLLKVTSTCPIHCRYCFRKYSKKSLSISQNDEVKILDYIKNDASIFEVILSGGDPLMLPLRKLERWIDNISKINLTSCAIR